MASVHTTTEAKRSSNFKIISKIGDYMTSVHNKTEAENFLYGFGSLDNRGRKLCLCFGSHPRPKATHFWPRSNMPRFWNQGKISKPTGTKSPYCISASNDSAFIWAWALFWYWALKWAWAGFIKLV